MKLLEAERDENTCRKSFTESEAVAMARAIREVESPKAKERQEATRAKPGNKKAAKRKNGTGKLPVPNQVGGKLPATYTPIPSQCSPRRFNTFKAIEIGRQIPRETAAVLADYRTRVFDLQTGFVDIDPAQYATELVRDVAECAHRQVGTLHRRIDVAASAPSEEGHRLTSGMIEREDVRTGINIVHSVSPAKGSTHSGIDQ